MPRMHLARACLLLLNASNCFSARCPLPVLHTTPHAGALSLSVMLFFPSVELFPLLSHLFVPGSLFLPRAVSKRFSRRYVRARRDRCFAASVPQCETCRSGKMVACTAHVPPSRGADAAPIPTALAWRRIASHSSATCDPLDDESLRKEKGRASMDWERAKQTRAYRMLKGGEGACDWAFCWLAGYDLACTRVGNGEEKETSTKHSKARQAKAGT